MISYVSGILAEAGEKGVVVETGGVGFFMTVPVSLLAELPPIGSGIRLYTHFHVTEDALKLYGFKSPEDRELFRMLLGISGVGPKAAVGLLGTMSANDLKLAVLADDEKKIARAPGLGPKTAKKIILDLKDKFKLSDLNEALGMPQSVSAGGGSEREDALEALVALGYSASESLSLITRLGDTAGMTSDEILSLALRRKVN